MILVDTNVISEVMKVSPSESVVNWLNAQESSALYLSTITIGEIEYGLRILPVGKRGLRLKERFQRFVSLAFAQRILAYDETAARTYGELMGHRKEIGRPMSIADGQIAAIAIANGLMVATRNTKDFKDCGLELINPFLPQT
ncbi:PIN domain-containing protein [Thiorhodococcus minor]|uniref:Ribonuclease VapC n=1 Tax=Thiorhodococcus minor TaxID=57489 RepID=A0A6M0K4Q6_9GAMM|nr:type II toxin-antitoxin system VapC family toxin [Thiorhodococcus minor]